MPRKPPLRAVGDAMGDLARQIKRHQGVSSDLARVLEAIEDTEGKSEQAREKALALARLGGAELRSSPRMGYMARMVVQCGLPHADKHLSPGVCFERVNGDFKLCVEPGRGHGVPYGIYPRLILAYLTQEVQRTKNQTVSLGGDFTTFMERIGVRPEYGKGRSAAQLKTQLERLLASRIWVEVKREDPRGRKAEWVRLISVANGWQLWWDPKNPDQGALMDSSVILGDWLYEDMLNHPVPFNWDVVDAIKKSPLRVDLYLWLGLRLSYLTEPTPIAWESLAAQLGSEYSDVRRFAQEVKRGLKEIKRLWPDLRYTTPRGRLILHPSPTHVPKLAQPS